MIPPVPILATLRFRLRGLVEDDVAAFWPSFSDEETMRYWSCAAFTDISVLRDWLFDTSWGGRTWIAEPLAGGPAICRVVANIDMTNIDVTSTNGAGIAEIGYLTAIGNERQGIARECVAALIDHLIGTDKVHKIIADIDPRNDASNRLVKSLGFTQEAHLREAMKTHIGWCDSLIWGLLAREWRIGQTG